MTASVGLLATLVSVALAMTAVSLLVLLGLLIKDWKKGKLW